MRGNPRASLIITLAEEHPSLPRAFQTAAMQNGDPDRAELIVAAPERLLEDVKIWETALDMPITAVPTADEATVPAMRNAAAKHAQSPLLSFLHASHRLDRHYLDELLDAHDDVPEADFIYTDYVRMSQNDNRGASGLMRLAPFDEDAIRRTDILGPSVTVLKETFERLEMFREDFIYSEWDLHVRAAQSGCAFLHIAYPLLSAVQRKVGFRERALDGRGKALVVIANPGYFHGHTLRWALSYLRGESWAEAWTFRTIPTAVEVSHMLNAHTINKVKRTDAAEEAVRAFTNNVIPFTA
ncbi:hypothetical protein [Desulfovibrio oxyclinae]|uniref:hypothetical protein n=1 Tax=Desulfovibrio oxyclinae TaxID=63560 RepID=UPI0012EA7244|nr:hypothetical protein [Desulfovibrio oxyclinae]